ncbi:alpha,alpha-trehalose-phosphate synthase (UDP-forming) [Mesorhizobium sp. L-8-10]|uniref:alpha,alpha-trehalose-phosphate synthase (UDP-forming) n=1 Tax=unclassified Mesorhizobium TaxID=325217 RepID=UPI0019280AB1|nr:MULTISPECIES: alpha,alpha-trehalose-phosphate synthase (UDP-forming) [unclassified Mesorhizobium]BCH26063.1 alpha,alpha-trehalose-phosphate synthase (UDP-forming) [Mesorhizobium sp. L-8-3]BCH34053.1 alpha,alpha-trehalose-phosphate synthase (UDP-forming) [Mesorhizobium sp. L-8-10]
MSRLVVVSNRVATPAAGAAQAGGLAVAMRAALAEHGGVWTGWSGKSSGEHEPGKPFLREEGRITYALTDLSQTDIDEYYTGFANSVLWPLCHYRLDLTDYARKDMAGYFRVNRFFAQQLAQLLQPDDLIWVQDYHLIPMAAELRRMGVTNRVGFFLHIPWPPPDVFFTVPVYETLLRGLTAYDVVGFQTRFDADNFASCLEREGIARNLGEGWFDIPGHRFRVGVYPISIDTKGFAELSSKATQKASFRRMEESFREREVIVGVDRLDYSKGLTHRIEAFDRFITDNPAYLGRATLLQITPKSRSEVPQYAAMQRQVAELAGRVNGQHGTLEWVPIRYVNRSIGQATLAGIYRVAPVGLVTPLRDGMNLVAKEYVAAQDPEDPGVLVLSRFSGAARELDGAILVNPYDTEAVANAIAKALSMPVEARRERWQQMMPRLLENDISKWCSDFLAALRGG